MDRDKGMSELKTAKDLQDLYAGMLKCPDQPSIFVNRSSIALIERIDAAETRVDELERRLLSCVFCGFVGDDVEQLKAHSAMCEKHPIIALVRENDGRRWERLHTASTNAMAWLSRNGLDGNSAYDDLAAALDAIPQSAEPPAPAAEPRYTMDHITWRAITEMCSVEQVNAISGRVLQLRWEQRGGA